MPEVGFVVPAHASALGKALLAFRPYARGQPANLRSMTGETITSPEALRRQLDEIRATGSALEEDEAVLGESSVASPVFDSWGGAVGAIGVVIPSGNLVPNHEARDIVRESARALSRELGASSWPPPPSNS